jgi:hypothetical protein
MNDAKFNALLSSLDHALEILAQHRAPDADNVAAYDALKQARALAVQAFSKKHALSLLDEERAAA